MIAAISCNGILERTHERGALQHIRRWPADQIVGNDARERSETTCRFRTSFAQQVRLVVTARVSTQVVRLRFGMSF